jgi:uncharacterized membrane-anchored protein YhcB (DUF1043 family)
VPNGERERKLQETLEAERNAHNAYREQVNTHFAKTSELFQDMTDNYRAVYHHLAQGAHELCESGQETPQLDLPEAKLVESPSSQPPAKPADTRAAKPAKAQAKPSAANAAVDTSEDEAEMEANAGPGPLPSVNESTEEEVAAEVPLKKGAVLH